MCHRLHEGLVQLLLKVEPGEEGLDAIMPGGDLDGDPDEVLQMFNFPLGALGLFGDNPSVGRFVRG